ncbi:MAG: aminotransferase class V-fold PLP-dependent enzyme [Planctomycetota bacterium]|nr:MAG: aminotransferase class V-fold PLP-dependent enzyme [Planctomycetota bacterium]
MPADVRPLYLDHAATAPVLAEAMAAFEQAAREAYANPSSLHAAGAAAARRLERARQDLRAALGADRYRVVWTGTGTEGNYLGIQGLARRLGPAAARACGGRPRVLVGAIEHPSAKEAAKALVPQGFQVDSVPVDGAGIVRPAGLRPLLGPGVALVVIQWANNELGGLNPIRELAALTRNLAPGAAFHVDAVQAAGKLATPLDELGADAVAVAAHKLGGVRGCAALLLREDGPLPQPLTPGAGHEGGLRGGTENVAGAAAFAAAAAARRARLQAEPRRYLDRRARLLALLRDAVPDLVPLGAEREEEMLPSILAVAVPGALAEPLLHRMEAEGVYVGSGSACHSHGPAESPVLIAIQCPKHLRGSVLRFSLDGGETADDLQRAAGALRRCLAAV